MPRSDRLDAAARRRGGRRVASLSAIVLGVVMLTGCGRASWSDGLLVPGVTEGAERVTRLWVGTWITAIVVGLLVLGLIEDLSSRAQEGMAHEHS